ncbi:hypothetical protein D770_06790 [Flammeovirgaceae bacterium 311]|nr:hypothetical protein D770_06790 [Flammeovirgaceae bacterium 311]
MRDIFVLALVLIMLGCEKDPHTPTFDYNQNAGIWVPYELVFDNGNVLTVSEDNYDYFASLFGQYVSCVRLNQDKTYHAVSWTTIENYTVTNKKGAYWYDTESGRLIFEIGTNPTDRYSYRVVEIEGSNMILEAEFKTLIKLRKRL